MRMFERYLSEEFDDNYDDCLKDMKDKLAVRWADVKTMKKKIIDMPNKVFINGEDK